MINDDAYDESDNNYGMKIFSIRDRFERVATGGWVTGRFPKIRSGSLIEMPKVAFWAF